MTWCGYIDVLGSRDAARRSAQDLLESLDRFHSALADAADKLDGDCYAFSDGAFFSCNKFEDFYPFIRQVRNQLFQGGTYFRCSFLPGDIGVHTRKPKHAGKSNNKFVSYTFTKAAPEAYQKELNFKGVGCFVDIKKPRFEQERKRLAKEDNPMLRSAIEQEIVNLESDFEKSKRSMLVISFFIEIDRRRVITQISSDFRYSPDELSERQSDVDQITTNDYQIFDKLISSCYNSLAKSSKTASYYISALVSVVRSIDLSEINWNEQSGGWENTPYPFRQLMAEGTARLLRDVPGFSLLLLVCFDKAYEDSASQIPARVEAQIMRQLLRIPSCFRNLDSVPEYVISIKARHRLVELKLAEALQPRQRARIAKARSEKG